MKNMNDLAKEIARLEGGKKELSIAQIKEVLRCLRDLKANNIKARRIWDKYLARDK